MGRGAGRQQHSRSAPLAFNSWQALSASPLAALDCATSVSLDVTAVYIALDSIEAEKIRVKWEQWGNGVRLVVITSPYGTLLEFVESVARARLPGAVITIVAPQQCLRCGG